MSMFVSEIREGRKWIIAALCAFVLFIAIFAVGTLAWAKRNNPNQGMVDKQGEMKVGLQYWATGTFEIFECASRGHDCSKFDTATSRMQKLGDRFTYTPLPRDVRGDGPQPGSRNRDGTRTVTLSDLSDTQWKTVGQAVMRGQSITLSDVPPSAMRTSGHTARFAAPSAAGVPRATGKMVFDFTGPLDNPDQVQVLSVTYAEKGQR